MNDDIADRLRRALDRLRRTSMPLKDLIPLVQEAIDVLEGPSSRHLRRQIRDHQPKEATTPYSSAAFMMLDRETNSLKGYMPYPITRVELMEFDGNQVKPTRIFVVNELSKWIELQ